MELERVSLFISFFGILVLIFLSQTIEPKEIRISDINSKILEGYVKIRGNLTNINQFDNLQILKIEDKTGSINAVLYQKTNLSEGKQLEIIGKVIRYKGNLEIEIQKLKELE